jgi:uncharacterized protein YjeT (DUF2065 family)
MNHAHLSFAIMTTLGLVTGTMGMPMLLAPALARRLLRLPDQQQSAYILRIVGTMLAALGAILIVFAFALRHFSVQPQG